MKLDEMILTAASFVLVLRLRLPSVRIVPGQRWAEARRCAEIVERKAVR